MVASSVVLIGAGFDTAVSRDSLPVTQHFVNELNRLLEQDPYLVHLLLRTPFVVRCPETTDILATPDNKTTGLGLLNTLLQSAGLPVLRALTTNDRVVCFDTNDE